MLKHDVGERDVSWSQTSSMAFMMLPAVRLSKGNPIKQAFSSWTMDLEEAVEKPLRGSRSLILSNLCRFKPVKLVMKSTLLSQRGLLITVLKPLRGWRSLPSLITFRLLGIKRNKPDANHLTKINCSGWKQKIYQRNESHTSVTFGFFLSFS